jgi:sRNA-binding protein
MASIETIQAALDRMEREQRVRDDGIRRALDIYANEFRRLQTMVSDRVAETHQVMGSITDLLTRQDSLIESVRELVEDRAMDEGDDWDEPAAS